MDLRSPMPSPSKPRRSKVNSCHLELNLGSIMTVTGSSSGPGPRLVPPRLRERRRCTSTGARLLGTQRVLGERLLLSSGRPRTPGYRRYSSKEIFLCGLQRYGAVARSAVPTSSSFHNRLSEQEDLHERAPSDSGLSGALSCSRRRPATRELALSPRLRSQSCFRLRPLPFCTSCAGGWCRGLAR